MEWRFDNTFDSFTLNIGPYIVAKNILLADITEATYMVKSKAADADVDAVITLTLGSGLTKVAGATEADATITAQFSNSDFTGVVTGTNYYVGFGIKTSSLTKFLEIPLVDDRLKITPDFIHD